MKYPILAKSITLLDGATRLPELSASGAMSQQVSAGLGPRGEETILEVHEHDVVVYRTKLAADGQVLKGQFRRVYIIPKAHCRVSLIDDDTQPEHLQPELEGLGGDALEPRLDTEVKAAKPSAERKSVVITPKAEQAKKE